MATSRSMLPKAKPFPQWAWAVYFLALWQVLLSEQNPGLMSDDSGEMVAASIRLGLPHPPGYPLFDLVGRLFSFVPVGGVAFRFNLLSAFFMLFSLVVVLDTCRKLGNDNRRVPFLFILLIVSGVLFISYKGLFAQCLTAKGCVYGLTLLLVSMMVWLRNNASFHRTALLLAWFLWGGGVANHWQTQVLLAPALVYWLFTEINKNRLKFIFQAASLGLVGISLYLYLPLRAHLGVLPSWGNPVNLRDFYWVVSRQLVKGSENWFQPVTFYLHSLGWIFRVLVLYWMPGFFFLVLLGTWALWRSNRQLVYFLFLLVFPVLLGVALVHEERNQYLVPVYLVSLTGVILLFGFAGSAWVLGKLPKAQVVVLGFLGLVSLGWFFKVFNFEDKSRYTLAEDFGTNVLKTLPRNALLLADGDHYVMSLWYLQYALGKRPDVTFEPSVFLYHNWGWDQLAAQAPDLRKSLLAQANWGGRMAALSKGAAQHPLFYSLGQEYLKPVLETMPGQWVPDGLTYRWTSSSPDSDEVLRKVLFQTRLERLRGVADNPVFVMLDPSSFQIYRYYALQYDLAGQYRASSSPEKPVQRAK